MDPGPTSSRVFCSSSLSFCTSPSRSSMIPCCSTCHNLPLTAAPSHDNLCTSVILRPEAVSLAVNLSQQVKETGRAERDSIRTIFGHVRPLNIPCIAQCMQDWSSLLILMPSIVRHTLFRTPHQHRRCHPVVNVLVCCDLLWCLGIQQHLCRPSQPYL